MGARRGGGVRVVIDGGVVVLPAGVADVDDALAGVEHTVAGVAAGEHAVEHVDAAADALQQVGGGAYAHEVAGLRFGEDVAAQFGDAVHVGDGLAYGEASDGVAGLVLISDKLAGLGTQVIEAAALYDGKEGLRVTVLRPGFPHEGDAALQPAVSEVHATLGVLAGGGVGGALVEGHDDIGTDGALDAEAALRTEQVLAAVDVTGEGGALLGDLAAVGEAVDLVAAAVSQEGAVPLHELVESAGGFHYLHAGAEVEVVGVAENDLCPHLFPELPLVDALDGTQGAYGHEDGRLDSAVIGSEQAGAGVGGGVGVEKVEGHGGRR